MSSYGHYEPWTDTWVFSCAGCGEEFRVSDFNSPLDGLSCCSAECDQEVEREVLSRPRQICRRCECEIDPFDGICGCDPPDA